MVGFFIVVFLGLFEIPGYMTDRVYSDIEWPEADSNSDRSRKPSTIENFYDPGDMNYLDLYENFSSEEDRQTKWETSERQKPYNEISGESKTILKILDHSLSQDEKKSELRGNKFIPNEPRFTFEARLHNYYYPKEREALPEVRKPLEDSKNCSDALESVLRNLLRNIRPISDETTELPVTTVSSALLTKYIPEYILKSNMTRYAEGPADIENDSTVSTTPIPSQTSDQGETLEIQNLGKFFKNFGNNSILVLQAPIQVPSEVPSTEYLLGELIRYAKNHTDTLEFIKLQLSTGERMYKIGSAILGSALSGSTTTASIPQVSSTLESTTPELESTTQESSTLEISSTTESTTPELESTTKESSAPEITTSDSILPTTSQNEFTTDEETFNPSSNPNTTQSDPTSEISQTETIGSFSPTPTSLKHQFQRRRRRHVTSVKTEVYNELCHLETDLSISSSESNSKSPSNSQSLKTVQSEEVGEKIDKYLKDETNPNLDTEILNIDPIVEHIHAKLLKKEKKPYGYEKSKNNCITKTAKPAPLELELSIETEELIEHPPPFIKSAK